MLMRENLRTLLILWITFTQDIHIRQKSRRISEHQLREEEKEQDKFLFKKVLIFMQNAYSALILLQS